MNSRQMILESLRSVETEKFDLPLLNFSEDNETLLQDFIEMAEASGMGVVYSSEKSLADVLRELQGKKIQTFLEGLREDFPVVLDEKDPFDKEKIPDVFICKAQFGVAENAAMWLDDEVLPFRILAFLPEELIIVLDMEKIVSNMHRAYEIVHDKGYEYGLFIAGPSKTADIEQTLVTGAQGAKKVTIFLNLNG